MRLALRPLSANVQPQQQQPVPKKSLVELKTPDARSNGGGGVVKRRSSPSPTSAGQTDGILSRLEQLEAYKKMVDETIAARELAEQQRDAAEAQLQLYLSAWAERKTGAVGGGAGGSGKSAPTLAESAEQCTTAAVMCHQTASNYTQPCLLHLSTIVANYMPGSSDAADGVVVGR
jgi:hypothetical protein